MTEPSSNSALIVLNVPPILEEPVVDWLLARGGDAGFTSFPVSGHSTSHDMLSPAEQVSGRQRRQQFQVAVREENVDAFLSDVGEAFGDAGVHVWVMPLTVAGRLGPRN